MASSLRLTLAVTAVALFGGGAITVATLAFPEGGTVGWLVAFAALCTLAISALTWAIIEYIKARPTSEKDAMFQIRHAGKITLEDHHYVGDRKYLSMESAGSVKAKAIHISRSTDGDHG